MTKWQSNDKLMTSWWQYNENNQKWQSNENNQKWQFNDKIMNNESMTN